MPPTPIHPRWRITQIHELCHVAMAIRSDRVKEFTFPLVCSYVVAGCWLT